ncbi:MAG: DUF4831 family protein [Prevotellaceae bacterium]|jgi:hypothetical protein|nr:DUF4831 family protein [Prevotellaceae bacterium]
MKKQIIQSFIPALSLFFGTIAAQSTAIMYSLPATELCVEVTYEKTTETPGEFYRYSERYLATSDVITSEKTSYRLKGITVNTRPVADAKRTYPVIPSGKSKLTNITVNSQGILCGMNVPATEFVASTPETKLPETTDTNIHLLPLNEEYVMAGSSAKMAEGIAKQIYFIRESRFNLITGDVDHLPADGNSLNTMLQEMNKTEKELTALFIGKRTVETATQTVYFTPSEPVTDILFRFSSISGVVASDDLSGTPYHINIVPRPTTLPPPPKRSSEPETLLTVVPALTQISITEGKEILYATQLQIPQLGSVIAVPDAAIKSAEAKITVDIQTGRLISIQ